MSLSPPDVLMLGTGEYTTGFTGQGASDSDKSTGVVALVMLDLQRRGKVGKLGMCGTDGKKLPAIRAHMQRVLGDVYTDVDPTCISTWPKDGIVNREAYREAIAAFAPGSVAIIFTPDDTHAPIASACIAAGLHVLVTKPPVKTLAEHNALAAEAAAKQVLCSIEVHKRYDPIYIDARDRIASSLGDFSYFTAHMSQPKHQLDTFKSWAGRSSDISYYLNSHHVDFHDWCMLGLARPESVSAFASTGVAESRLGRPCEDTITLAVRWRNRATGDGSAADDGTPRAKRAKVGMAATATAGPCRYTGTAGHATYTSSWVAAKSDVHSQQRWFYMGHKGEVSVDQAHRGYTIATDAAGFASVNPLFWKPARDAITGHFAGQRCYGYLSFEAVLEAAAACNAGKATTTDYDGVLPTMATTAGATAILEAGRRSLDAGGRPMELLYAGEHAHVPTGIRPVEYPPH